jgi:hypothetical protein
MSEVYNDNEELVSAEEADAAIAEAVKKALAKTDDEASDNDAGEEERSVF